MKVKIVKVDGKRDPLIADVIGIALSFLVVESRFRKLVPNTDKIVSRVEHIAECGLLLVALCSEDEFEPVDEEDIEVKVGGVLGMSRFSPCYTEDYFLSDELIAVTPEMRGHGIGQKLINRAVTFAEKDPEIIRIIISTLGSDDPAAQTSIAQACEAEALDASGIIYSRETV